MSSDERMQVTIDHRAADSGIVTALVAGEIDPVTAPQLERQMQATLFTAAPKELVLDFSAVTFMDSSGIRVLIDLHHSLRDRGGRLVLANLGATPRRILEVSGLTAEFELR